MKSRKNILRLLALLILTVTLLLSFSACGKSNKKIAKINFALDWTPNTNHTGLYVAKALGYYKAEGLDVNIQQAGETGTSSLVATGKMQFGIDFQEQMYANYHSGVNVTAIASLIQHNTSGILSLKEKGINSPKDMADKKYSTYGLPVEQTIIENLIKQDGGMLPADIKKLYYPNFTTDPITTIDQGLADSAWVYEAWDALKARLKDPDKYNYFALRDFDKDLDWYTPVFIGNNNYMKSHKKQTEAFLRATRKGYEYAMKYPEKAAEIFMNSNPEYVTSKELIIESQKMLAKKYYEKDDKGWGYIDGARWRAFYKYLNNHKAEIAKKSGLDSLNNIPEDYGYTNEYIN